MHRAVIGPLIFAVDMLCGCGGSAPESKFTASPHAGKIIELPSSYGYVALTTERGGPLKKGSKEKPKPQIAAYFYQPDGTTIMSPTPSDVKIALGAAGSGTVVNLAANSSEPGAFAYEAGDYPDELRGHIDFQLGGNPIQATFSFR